jgi:pimeloyl-ACP methyl ester carboxylesterase
VIKPPETKFIGLPDQRKIAYCEYGKPNGKPIFYFHGSPGSRYEPLLGDQAATRHGIRLLAPDRPGIGRSDFLPGRSLLDWPIDVASIADQLDISTFGVIGASGGGPHALSCAHSLPHRLSFTLLLGSWAPVASTGLAQQMAPLDQFFSRLAHRPTFFFSLPFYWFVLSSRYLPKNLFVRSLDSSLCEADKKILEDQHTAAFSRRISENPSPKEYVVQPRKPFFCMENGALSCEKLNPTCSSSMVSKIDSPPTRLLSISTKC